MVTTEQPDAIDTRGVFRVYAWVAGMGGLVVMLWGQSSFGPPDLFGQPWGRAALVRVFGSIVIAAGCCAAALGSVEDPASRHRGLRWFAVGHGVVASMVFLQWQAIWGEPGPAYQAVLGLLLTAVLVLFYFWQTGDGHRAGEWLAPTGLFGDRDRQSAEPPRSTYEQQIRQAAAQEERNRLARELHDSIKQQIFVIQTAAATAQIRFDEDRAGASQALEQVRTSAREAMTEMEVLLDQLRAVPLENSGLVGALKRQCEALGHRTGAEVAFELGTMPPSETLSPGAHQAIFRVAQEALANIGRHARARTVRVGLDSDVANVTLTVEDDGTGFETGRHAAAGLGIGNMRARAGEFGGSLDLESLAGSGTCLRLSIPIAQAPDRSEYGRRALVWGTCLLILAVVSTWEFATGREGMFIAEIAFTVFAAVVFGRSMIAYRHVRQGSAGTPWPQSPSHS